MKTFGILMEKMSVRVNVHTSEIIWTPIKVGVRTYASNIRQLLNPVTSWNIGFTIMPTLFYFGYQGCWEQEGNAWQYFRRKTLSKTSVKLLIFYKSGMFLYLKWENLPAKAGKNRGITALPKPLVAIGQL